MPPLLGGWQVIPYDMLSSRSGVAMLQCELLYIYFTTTTTTPLQPTEDGVIIT